MEGESEAKLANTGRDQKNDKTLNVDVLPSLHVYLPTRRSAGRDKSVIIRPFDVGTQQTVRGVTRQASRLSNSWGTTHHRVGGRRATGGDRVSFLACRSTRLCSIVLTFIAHDHQQIPE